LDTTTLFLMTLQFLTGILLLFYYVPTTDHAWNSVYYIMNDVYFGQLIRGIHYWSSNFLLAFIGLHMLQVFLSRAYKAPREVNWVLGVTLLLLTLLPRLRPDLRRRRGGAHDLFSAALRRAVARPPARP
jgi:menaquinol-cytochrome c reductase cytochrome b subunit